MSIAIQAPRSLEPLYCQGIYSNSRLESPPHELASQSYPSPGTSQLMSAMAGSHNPRHPYGAYAAPQSRPPQYDPIQASPPQFAPGQTPPAQMQRLPMMTPPAPLPSVSTPTLVQSPVLQQEAGGYATYSPATEPASPAPAFTLTIRQEPDRAKVVLGKDKDRKPVDPPPILQLEVPPQNNHILQSPYHFVMAFLIDEKEDTPVSCQNGNPLFGTQVSSLHKLKDTNNQDGGFFVFGDLSVRVEGKFRLKFTLYEVSNGEVVQLGDITSRVFEVYSPKLFPGMEESTFLTRSFSDQGVRLRLRKDSRSMTTRKRSSQVAKLDQHQQRYQPRARMDQHQPQQQQHQSQHPQQHQQQGIPPPPVAAPGGYDSMHQGNGWWTTGHASPHTPGGSGPPSAGPYGPTSQGYGHDAAPRYGPQ